MTHESEDIVYQARTMHRDRQHQIRKLFKVATVDKHRHRRQRGPGDLGFSGSFSAAQEYVATGEFARGDPSLSDLPRKFGFAIPLQVERGNISIAIMMFSLTSARTHNVRYELLHRNTNPPLAYLRKRLKKLQPLSCSELGPMSSFPVNDGDLTMESGCTLERRGES
jgi:hypothetical protein